MDVEWHMTDDALARIRTEAARAHPDERGRFLKPLADLHAEVRGHPGRIDVELFIDTAIEFAADATLFERMAFANDLADIGHIPQRLVDTLVRDVYLVSRPLIERAKLSDRDLIAVLDGDTSESTLLAITKREGTGVAVTDRLVAHGSAKVHLALAANDRAALSIRTFDRFSDMTTAQNDMDLALAQRSDLPVHIAKALYQRLSERSQKRLAEMLLRDRNRGRRVFSLGDR